VRTLSGLFDLSRSALAADQAALSATANNVANQNTAGYVRQVVTWNSGDSVSLGAGRNISASGPTLTTVSRRDRVLEQRVQQQTQVQAGTASQAAVLAQIESVLSLSGGSASAGATQIGTAINSFFSSLTALAGSPADAATRQGVLSAAGALASAFNAASTQLQQVRTSVSGEIGSSVTQVNALTGTIAKLNAQIGASSPGTDAGALENQRQLAIAQLSQFVGLDQISTEGNGITLTTTGGTVLVSGAHAFSLSAVTIGDATTIQGATGLDVTNTVQDGSIGGHLVAQNATLPGVAGALDAVAYRIGAAINAQNAAGTDGAGAVGTAIFALGATASGSAATISVIPTSASAIATAGAGEGPAGNTNAVALQDLGDIVDGSGSTIAGQYASLLSQVGTNSSAMSEQQTTQAASLTQLTTQRDSLSGVSLDDEAANLSQYQRSYQAAARVLSVLDTLLASAINLGTATTVS
jgi:flagellar hook-associated protein 1 FlgK